MSRHGVYYYVPGLLKQFTTSQINALIAPRAHLGLAGLQDKLTPVEGLDIIDRELTKVYAAPAIRKRWKLCATTSNTRKRLRDVRRCRVFEEICLKTARPLLPGSLDAGGRAEAERGGDAIAGGALWWT